MKSFAVAAWHLLAIELSRASEISEALALLTVSSKRVVDTEGLSRSAPPNKRQPSAATSGSTFVMEKSQTYNGPEPEPGKPEALSFETASCKSDKWAVTTSIFEPTTATIEMATRFPDWCLLVIGDKKSPNDKYLDGSKSVVFLSAQRQEEVVGKLETFKHTPWNSFARKNLGYLYAMGQGATVIFDFDDDNFPVEDPLWPAVSEASDTTQLSVRMVETTASHANIYPMFTDVLPMWPRGLPLTSILLEADSPSAPRSSDVSVEAKTIGVAQSLAQGDPDVDAIFRLTRETGENGVEFENRSPVVLPQRVFSPFNAQATVWHKPAFAAMLLPSHINGRVADIWRSYISQPVLWSQNLLLAFTAAHVAVIDRNPHNAMGDFEAEWPLYYQTEALLGGLLEEHARLKQEKPHATAATVLFELYKFLFEHGIVPEDDVKLCVAWIEDLASLGVV